MNTLHNSTSECCNYVPDNDNILWWCDIYVFHHRSVVPVVTTRNAAANVGNLNQNVMMDKIYQEKNIRNWDKRVRIYAGWNMNVLFKIQKPKSYSFWDWKYLQYEAPIPVKTPIRILVLVTERLSWRALTSSLQWANQMLLSRSSDIWSTSMSRSISAEHQPMAEI